LKGFLKFSAGFPAKSNPSALPFWQFDIGRAPQSGLWVKGESKRFVCPIWQPGCCAVRQAKWLPIFRNVGWRGCCHGVNMRENHAKSKRKLTAGFDFNKLM